MRFYFIMLTNFKYQPSDAIGNSIMVDEEQDSSIPAKTKGLMVRVARYKLVVPDGPIVGVLNFCQKYTRTSNNILQSQQLMV